jgi:multisubunit Na+/H+ antiporter MnhE subunit
VPLDGYSDAEVTLLANFITLTPGTLSLDVKDGVDIDGVNIDETDRNRPESDRTDGKGADSKRVLYVHAMHAGRTQAAIEQFRDQLRQNLGRRVTEVMR